MALVLSLLTLARRGSSKYFPLDLHHLWPSDIPERDLRMDGTSGSASHAVGPFGPSAFRP